jgi:peptide deformylase
MILEILKFPDPRLRKKSVVIEQVTPVLKKLAEDMLETMYITHGIGLAAPQVGESVRLLVIDTRPKDEDGAILHEEMSELERKISQPLIIFNPEILQAKEKTTYDEGCLSVPGFFETVQRSKFVEVKGLGINGEKLHIETDGLLAICLQHEVDHLEGKLFIDRLSLIKSNRIKNRIKKQGYPTAEEVEEERAEARSEVRPAARPAKSKRTESI